MTVHMMEVHGVPIHRVEVILTMLAISPLFNAEGFLFCFLTQTQHLSVKKKIAMLDVSTIQQA